MLILSHRGYHADVPENTVAAFERAQRLGVDGIETDLHLASDGQVILFHDRVAPNGQPISGLTRSELSQVVGFEVPTLDEALAAFADLFWNLEIKAPAALTAALAIMRPYARRTKFLLSSFWHPVVVEALAASPYDCGLLVAHRPCDFASFMSSLKGPRHRIGVVWDFQTTDPAIVEQAKSAGLKCFVYGPKTQADHELLRQLNVDGVISDTPQFLLG